MEKNIKILIDGVPAGERKELIDVVEILMKERIQIVKNEMDSMLGLPAVEIPKERITKCVTLLNNCADKNGIDFHIDEDWESIEYFMKNSILDDLAEEFKRQANA